MMTTFHQLLELEWFSLALLAALSIAVGQGVASSQPDVLRAGKRGFVGVFLCFMGIGLTEVSFDSNECLALFIRGLLIAASCYGISLLLIPIVAGLYDCLILKPIRAMRYAWYCYQMNARDKRRLRQQERLRQQSQLDWDRSQPHRDRLAVEAEQRQQREAAEHIRRENARAECELLFSLHAPEMHTRFGRPDLEHFMQTYMGNGMSVDEVERRGKELQRIIDQHRQHTKPDRKPRTIQDLAEWFVQEKQRIEGLPLEPDIKDEHLVQLNIRYAELTQDLLQKMEP